MKYLEEEGKEIAKKLGNGVRCLGPQMDGWKLVYHLFNDDTVTDSSFTGLSFEEASQNLINCRIRFGKMLPSFRQISSPKAP